MDEQTRIERIYLGHASAYAYAVSKGYTGTEEEFAQLCADLGIQVGYLEDMTVVVNILEPGTPATASYVDGVLTLGIPQGEKGDPAPSDEVVPAVNAWLSENVDPDTGYVLDRSLQSSEAAAPADMVGDLRSAVDGNCAEIGYGKNYFSYTTGTAHPASSDSAYVSIHSGDEYTVKVTGTASVAAQVYAFYANGTNKKIGTGAGATVVVTETAEADTVSIGVYIPSSSTYNADVTFEVITDGGLRDRTEALEDSVDTLKEQTDDIASNVGDFSTTFSVTSGTGHAAADDKIIISMAQGTHYRVSIKAAYNVLTQVYEYTSGGTSTKVATQTGRDWALDLTASANIVAIGFQLPKAYVTHNDTITFSAFLNSSLSGRVYDLEHPPDKFLDKLNNAKRKANGYIYTSLTSPEIFTLAHFSDIHADTDAMASVVDFKNRYVDYLDDTICTGDMVSNKISDGMAFWTDGSILTCIGNHDSLGDDGWENPVDQATLYATYISPYSANWSAETVTDKAYYYKDYSEKKIRLIVVDGTIYDSTEQATQITWLTNALAGAKTAGYSVVGAVHFPPVSDNFTKVNCNFCALLHGTAYDLDHFAWQTYYASIMDAVQDFIDGGGDFVCWLSGHTHYDLVSYDSDYPKQLFLTITCARHSALMEEASRDGLSADALNVVCVDIVRKYIKVLRYGAEWDDCLRHKGSVIIQYGGATPAVMYQE